MGDENPDLFKKLPDGFRQKFTREILSRTSPADVMRLSLVSRSFRASANSDVVWDTFIPPDHRRLALQGLRNYTFDSSKRLFRYLCGTQRFWLDKWSGKMGLYIDHRSLAITQLDTDYWKKSVSGPVLGHVIWLEVCGRIPTSKLSPDTTYEAYLVFFLSKYVCYGFHTPIETSIGIPGEESTKAIIYLDPRIAESKSNHHYPNTKPRERITDSIEVKLGEYFNKKGENRDVEITLKEVKSGKPKCGVRIVGIEMRPKQA
ncbi:F-box protein At2g02240-like [Daucus carota subsp. sativus]|uniref:F-box protein At2g02240-like n=1 Tax=Daucus carota subsp. sativus TaxID=79200 RepID=UPI0007EF32AF|nr:PREDICTED: F-box protein At2g02240-like [Daucus carota subsp. sativus]